MGVTFYGNGSVFIPSGHSFIRFVDGKYTTDKAREIEVLAKTFEHDSFIKDPEQEIVDDSFVEDIADKTEKPKRGRKPNVHKSDS